MLSFLHCLTHTHTHKRIHARRCALIVLYNTFLKSAQRKEKREREKLVNCILMIKATQTHTHTEIVRCTQRRQMRENKYRCKKKENE